MCDRVAVLKELYACFNAGDTGPVLAMMADDVRWANAMDGGHEHGHDAVQAYWVRQAAVVRARVEPVAFAKATDGSIAATVRQTVLDVDGRPLRDATHGLTDKTIRHRFRFRDDQIVQFDVEEIEPPHAT